MKSGSPDSIVLDAKGRHKPSESYLKVEFSSLIMIVKLLLVQINEK